MVDIIGESFDMPMVEDNIFFFEDSTLVLVVVEGNDVILRVAFRSANRGRYRGNYKVS